MSPAGTANWTQTFLFHIRACDCGAESCRCFLWEPALSIAFSPPPPPPSPQGPLHLYQFQLKTQRAYLFNDETALNSANIDLMFPIAGQVELCWVSSFSNTAIGVLCHAACGL